MFRTLAYGINRIIIVYYLGKKYIKEINIIIKVGTKGIYYALVLYFVLQKDDVLYYVKAIIIGALGYFIFPIDLIPDVILLVGYTDDIGALVLAKGQVSMYIDENVKNSAKQQMTQWFDII